MPSPSDAKPSPVIRAACKDDLPAIGEILAAAFHDDPVWQWLAPAASHAKWMAKASRWFAAEASVYLRRDGAEVLVDDRLGGVAMWGAPGAWKTRPQDIARVALPSASMFGFRLPRALSTSAFAEKRHPEEPHHWYLGYIGTHPDHQGRGVGGALVLAITERCDAEGLPAYLESSKESNLGFYARFGFVESEPMMLGKDGPALWPMWREPKS
ncbi:MAG: GNAT family N-acetyltransferase [Aquihabitans sp.]